MDDLRPITLLNADYKILSKLLVRRVKPILPKIIKSGQLCTIGDKNILFGVSNIISSILHVKSKRKKACILSLDFFKAYDRVFLDYLLKVMSKMNFSPTFRSWIKMLHEGAQTKFLLRKLTAAIDVTFSIRQGDPLSMILFIIYIEPFLRFLERKLKGLQLFGLTQLVEAYCDDVNILTDSEDDILEVDTAVSKFEAMSGALLSRNRKCSIIGFGGWKERTNWPLAYVKTEKEVKIFGIYIQESYKSMLARNWSYRFKKFQNCLKSWSSRFLPSLGARVEVLNMFALSRVFYVASILPINKTMVKKFESALEKFLWNASGYLLRVAMDEVVNKRNKGGLNLISMSAMCNSLLTSQFLRLLKSSDAKSVKHVVYWIGDSLVDLLPDMTLAEHPNNVPDYFATIESMIVIGRAEDIILSGTWRRLTNKMIYMEKSKAFPVTKVEKDAGCSFSRVWQLINSPVLTSPVRDLSYLLVHNKLPVPERLFRVGIRRDPYCETCLGQQVNDCGHFFCQCSKVVLAWAEVKSKLINMIGVDIPDKQLISYLFPKCAWDKEVIWLLGNYLYSVWTSIHVKSADSVKWEQLFGFLKFKYREDQLGARHMLNPIVGFEMTMCASY